MIARRSRQIPRHGVIERLLHRFAAGRVKWIAARHHHRAADQIERHEQPAQRQIVRQHRRDLAIEVVILERDVGELRPVDQLREHLIEFVRVVAANLIEQRDCRAPVRSDPCSAVSRSRAPLPRRLHRKSCCMTRNFAELIVPAILSSSGQSAWLATIHQPAAHQRPPPPFSL